MPYPQHWLLQFGGHQGDVVEEWSCGIRMAFQDDPIGAAVDEEDFLDNQAMPALSTWFQDPLSYIGPVAKLLTIKFNEIDPAGRYVDQGTTHIRQVNYTGGGAGGGRYHPLQCACVLSWRNNDVARGPGSHGRIYSPRPYIEVDAAGDIAGYQRVDIAASAATMLNTLDTSIGVAGVFRPHIVSTLNGGIKRQIDRVVVDSCLDVHRSRAKQQSKEITSTPVLY